MAARVVATTVEAKDVSSRSFSLVNRRWQAAEQACRPGTPDPLAIAGTDPSTGQVDVKNVPTRAAANPIAESGGQFMRNPTPDFAGMDPGQAGRTLIGWAEQLQRMAQTYRDLHQQMSHLAVTETSADGMVRVTVDAQGVPTEMTLTDRARGVDPARLSAELMTCLRRAQRTLGAQIQDLVTASVQDSGDDATARIVASYRDRFPDLTEDAPARHARRTRPPDDDDLS